MVHAASLTQAVDQRVGLTKSQYTDVGSACSRTDLRNVRPLVGVCLVGLVSRASTSRAEDLGFESRLRRDFSGSSHTSDRWHFLDVIDPADGLAGFPW